jgi:hypothetical protein
VRGTAPVSFAITCVFATTRPSASLHPRFLKCRFRETLSYRELDPRPCPSARPALFTRDVDWLFSGSDCRPMTSATYFRRTVTLPSIRFSRFDMPRCCGLRCRIRPRSPRALRHGALRHGALRHDDLPLSKKDHESYEPQQSFRSPLDGAASAPQSKDPENPRPIETPLAGDASIQPSFAAMAVGRERWTARAEEPLSEGPAPYAACCRRTTRVKVPLLTELLEHPWVSSTLCTAGWMLPPSS